MTGFIGDLGGFWIIGEFVVIAMLVVMFVSIVKMSKRIKNIEQYVSTSVLFIINEIEEK